MSKKQPSINLEISPFIKKLVKMHGFKDCYLSKAKYLKNFVWLMCKTDGKCDYEFIFYKDPFRCEGINFVNSKSIEKILEKLSLKGFDIMANKKTIWPRNTCLEQMKIKVDLEG